MQGPVETYTCIYIYIYIYINLQAALSHGGELVHACMSVKNNQFTGCTYIHTYVNLQAALSQCGEIVDVRMGVKNNQFMGFAHVDFADQRSADAAVALGAENLGVYACMHVCALINVQQMLLLRILVVCMYACICSENLGMYASMHVCALRVLVNKFYVCACLALGAENLSECFLAWL